MNIKCNVNQTLALARGINAPHSTVVLDVDPATLTERERTILAAILQDGHDTTGGRLDTADSSPVPVGRTQAYSSCTPPLVLVAPTVDGLRAALAEMDADYTPRHAAWLKAKAAEDAEAAQVAQAKAAQVAEVRRKVIAGEMGLRENNPIYDTTVYAQDNTCLGRGADLELVITARLAAAAAAAKAKAEAAAAAAAKMAQEKADRKAESDRCTAIFVAALDARGNPAQKEIRKRGLMSAALAASLGRAIMEDAAFAGCPLPRFVPPS